MKPVTIPAPASSGRLLRSRQRPAPVTRRGPAVGGSSSSVRPGRSAPRRSRSSPLIPAAFEVVGLAAGGAHPELLAQQAAAHPAAAGRGRQRVVPAAAAVGRHRAHRRAGGHRAGRVRRRRHRAERDHRLDRPRTHPGRAAGRAGCWRWPTRSRWSPAASLVTGAAAPGQIVPGRFRAHRAGPVPARWCAAARSPGWCVTASGGPFRGRTRRADGRRHRRARRWPTRPGRWARWSPSTPRRWSTRASR